MVFLGVLLLILGILGRVFASVSHISDSTAKAMGWIILNKIVAFLSWFFLMGWYCNFTCNYLWLILLPTTFLATTFCVRATDTMFATLFSFVQIKEDTSHNKD